MIEVLPAIIPESYEDLTYKMSLVKGIANLVQVDVCDGKFVKSKSWPYVGDYEGHFERITQDEEEGFPFWQNIDFEADLMIRATYESVEKWIKAGAKAVILHVESAPNILEIIEQLRKIYGYSGDSIANVEIGVAINIDTPNEILYKFLEKDSQGRRLADSVQFMGIRRIGYQGQEFDNEVFEKISSLRKKYPDLTISVDGGVSFDNNVELIKSGANKLISGSAIYDSDDMKEAIEEMKNVEV